MAEPLDSRVEEILQGGDPPLLSRIEKLLKESGSGGVTPEQIAAAVEAYFNSHNIESLPDKTSASAGDFLRLDAQKNAVWETVPSAESNSFGGGS